MYCTTPAERDLREKVHSTKILVATQMPLLQENR